MIESDHIFDFFQALKEVSLSLFYYSNNIFRRLSMKTLYINYTYIILIILFGSVRSSRNANVRSFGTNVSRALNLHLSLTGQSQISSRSVLISPRSVPGQSQVSLRSPLGLSELTLSVRRSLKYFVLFVCVCE